METAQAVKITVEAANPSPTLLFIGLGLLGFGVVLFLRTDFLELLGLAIGCFGIAGVIIGIGILTDTSYHIDERQTVALEQQLEFTEVSVHDGKFTASDRNGKYVKGGLFKIDDLNYYVIADT